MKKLEKTEMLLNKLRGIYRDMLWDGRDVYEALVIEECIEVVNKELNKLRNKRMRELKKNRYMWEPIIETMDKAKENKENDKTTI